MSGPLGLSLAPAIRSSKTLYKWFKPMADWYVDVSGFRKLGYKYDDLIPEERDDVQRALKRLTPREQYDRAYRMKRASHASVLHQNLPKELWTPPNEDVRFLKPHIDDVVKEDLERAAWDHVTVTRK